jgi:hypothetical protein
VHLGDREGEPVAGPRLAEQPLGPVGPLGEHAHRLDVGVALPAVAAVRVHRVAPEPRVEEALARQVVVHPHDVGGAGRLGEGVQLGRIHAGAAHEIVPHRVAGGEAPGEQVDREPAALVLPRRLPGERRRRVRLARSSVCTSRAPGITSRMARMASTVPCSWCSRARAKLRSSWACGYQTPYSAEKRAVVSGSFTGRPVVTHG